MNITRNVKLEIIASAGLLLIGAVVGIVLSRKKAKCLREKDALSKQMAEDDELFCCHCDGPCYFGAEDCCCSEESSVETAAPSPGSLSEK